MTNETGPENKVSRIAAGSFRGRVECGCCTPYDDRGNAVKSRWTDHNVPSRIKKQVDRWQGRPKWFWKKSLRDHRR